MTVEILKSRMIREIENNPLFSFSLDKMNNYIKNKKFDKINEMDFVTKEIYNYVYSYAINEFKFIFGENLEENVFAILSLFLMSDKRENKNYKVSFIHNLLAKNVNSVGHYITGKLSYMIINLVHYFTFMLICFFLNPVLLQLDRKNKEKLIVNKSSVNNIDPNNLKKHFDENIKAVLILVLIRY